ncbi:hypothetical protein HRbin06_00391 [archaeon HR06]|nr:hypothetical protein HRbin06_00391 [archaeon HR06]
MKVLSEFKEPLKGYNQKLILASLNEMEVVSIKRKPSNFHVRRLSESISKIGFTTPLIGIEENGKIIVIDGQHRLLAAKQLGIKELPCIIIPKNFIHDLMELNIEKQMSLREKAYVALNVYRMYLKEDSSIKEDDPRIMDSIEYPYYITLGVAYEKNQRLFGSAYESILRRIDSFLSLNLKDSFLEREKRADKVIRVDELVREAVEKVKNLGISHPFLHREIVSFCSPIGRKRKIDLAFNEVLDRLMENLKNLIMEPERIRSHKFEETQEENF